MNTPMVLKLIHKDWLLMRWYMYGYIALGFLSVGLMATPNHAAYYTGVVMLITVLIAATAHIVFSSIVIERKEYQMSFIMALPLSPVDYFMSKMLGSLLIYLTVLLPILSSTLLIVNVSHLPNGMVPMILLSAVEILAAFSILICVSLLTKTEAATVVVMVLLNLLFNLFLFTVAQLPGIANYISTETAVFNSTVFTILAIEFLIIASAITLIKVTKSRRPCFL